MKPVPRPVEALADSIWLCVIEYLENRDDYGVSGLIEEQLPSLSDERAFEIDDSEELTSEELKALRTAMAENDFDGWDTHSGFYFKVRFGALYALFVGQDIGQGFCLLSFAKF